ncbi:MAG TPA: SRPBCC domain-containing protein [Mycobacteriales bacterium]|nr:SRPBCC domain-containing protein [Mycobacteriales bacterium]
MKQSLPPVVRSVVVPLPPADAFLLFTRDMEEWWPLDTFSVAADSHGGALRATGLVFEQRCGGRIAERLSDGSEAEWGRVLVWDPPSHVAFSWKPTLEAGPFTRVDVTFTETSRGSRVELVHSGWAAHGAAAAGLRHGYSKGWVAVLDRFRAGACG